MLKKRNLTLRWLIILLGLVIGAMVIAIGIISSANSANAARERGTVHARLLVYCLDIKSEAHGDLSDCTNEWGNGVMEVYSAEVLACHRQSPDLDRPFYNCLADEDILPPGVVRR